MWEVSSRTLASSGKPRRELGRDHDLGVGLERPADRVLALLGGVGLREDLGEEELEEVLVVLEPVVAVPLLPAAVRLVPLLELLLGGSARHSWGQRQGRRDEHHPGDAFRVPSGKQQRPLGAAGQRDEDGPIGAGRVHHGERVVRELLLDVGLRLRRAIRPPVTTTIEGDHAAVAGEVRDLQLPAPRVDDRPRGQQQNRRLALAVDLVKGPDAVPLDVALGVGVARTALLVAL